LGTKILRLEVIEIFEFAFPTLRQKPVQICESGASLATITSMKLNFV